MYLSSIMGRLYVLIDIQRSARISSFLVGGLVVAVSRIGYRDYFDFKRPVFEVWGYAKYLIYGHNMDAFT